jgi:hypothetical protein
MPFCLNDLSNLPGRIFLGLSGREQRTSARFFSIAGYQGIDQSAEDFKFRGTAPGQENRVAHVGCRYGVIAEYQLPGTILGLIGVPASA